MNKISKKNIRPLRSIAKLSLFFLFALITGCASTAPQEKQQTPQINPPQQQTTPQSQWAQQKQQTSQANSPQIEATQPSAADDPFETFNRHAFALNDAVDRIIFNPVTEVYIFILPNFAQEGVHNFFSNLGDIPNTVDNLLQGNLSQSGTSFLRLLINSTIGIAGFFDVATHFGLKEQKTDFGLTLAKWGIKKSPYLIIPFWGPSTTRDMIGLPVDYLALSPLTYVQPAIRNSVWGVQIIDTNLQYMSEEKLVHQAFDPYLFMRNAFLQHRNSLIKQMSAGIPVSDSGVQRATASNIELGAEEKTTVKTTMPAPNGGTTKNQSVDDIFAGN